MGGQVSTFSNISAKNCGHASWVSSTANSTSKNGDPNLGNERGHGADFSLRHQTSRARVEGRVSFGLHPNLWAHAGLDAVNAELRNPVLPLPRIPPLRGRFGFDARYKGFSLMPELVLANRQDRVYSVEEPTAGYAVVNVKALYSVTTQHTLHIFGASLFNASDRLYRNHLSFLKAFAPEIGRGVLFTYTMRFF